MAEETYTVELTRKEYALLSFGLGLAAGEGFVTFKTMEALGGKLDSAVSPEHFGPAKSRFRTASRRANARRATDA